MRMLIGVRGTLAQSNGHRRVRTTLLSALVSLAVAAACTASASAATLTRGFVDDVWFDSMSDQVPALQWVTKTVATGAKFVQIEVDWISLEPNAPTSADNLTSPAGAQFDFAYLDERVKEFVGSGLQPVFLVTDAPRWAEGKGGTPAEYATGGYKPNATALGDLAEAMARRYSGSYPDPAAPGKTLPRVRYYQAWAEANLNFHLSPQWTRSNGKVHSTGPGIYRSMLNAFYAGIHGGDRTDKVIASGLESYGDRPDTGLKRTSPVPFLEGLLCLDSKLARLACPAPAHFDLMASDPYDVGGPTVHAASPLDASAPDLAKLTRIVKAAVKTHTLLPSQAKPLWVTEFSYESNPPNRQGVSLATQARWLEQCFYVFAHEGVSTVLWYLVRDQPPPYSLNYTSGVYFRDGKPKPSYTAYRFPLVVMPAGQGAQIWGITPVSGTVQVQHRIGGSWRTVAKFSRGAGKIFYKDVSNLPKGQYRATVDGQDSLVWSF
jgi:hypothetical protein